MIGRHTARSRKEKGIAQKDFIAKMQAFGCDNPSGCSKSEGQIRNAYGNEVFAIANILDILKRLA